MAYNPYNPPPVSTHHTVVVQPVVVQQPAVKSVRKTQNKIRGYTVCTYTTILDEYKHYCDEQNKSTCHLYYVLVCMGLQMYSV